MTSFGGRRVKDREPAWEAQVDLVKMPLAHLDTHFLFLDPFQFLAGAKFFMRHEATCILELYTAIPSPICRLRI
jgi:hypothetical protein